MSNWTRRFLISLAALALLATGFALGSATLIGSAAPTIIQPEPVALDVAPQTGEPLTTDLERIYNNVYTQAANSVVSITVFSRTANGSPVFEDAILPSGGSGFVIDGNGRIVTNAHVVNGAESIEVRFLDGTIAGADIVGVDLDSDIAVIQVNSEDVPAERLRPVTFGNSDSLQIGQGAVAIGSPFGEEWTLTTGIISALDRSITGLNDFSIGSVIQTDAAINPGNSGGPLLNLQGQVIGVNSQILSSSRSNSGVGFAVPSNLVQRVATELIDKGEVDYSYLGISGGDMTLQLIDSFNLPNDLQGAVVRRVVPDGPAGQAGLQDPSDQGVDVITSINNTPIRNMDALLAYLADDTRPGDTVNVGVYRNGDLIDLTLTLGARPE